MTVLKEMIEHHVEEEESEMFGEARRVLGSKLETLGVEMQAFKDRATRAKPAGRKKTAARKTTATRKKTAARKKTAR